MPSISGRRGPSRKVWMRPPSPNGTRSTGALMTGPSRPFTELSQYLSVPSPRSPTLKLIVPAPVVSVYWVWMSATTRPRSRPSWRVPALRSYLASG